MIANLQPARLRHYLSDAHAGGPSDDGLFPRFQLLVWPDHPKEFKLVDRPPRAASVAIAEKIFSVLANLSVDSALKLRFSGDAQSLFYDWFAELEHRVRGDSLSPVMASHLAKYRSLMPSLAGLFELADLVATDAGLGDSALISLEHAKQAAALCEYLESHANRVYSCTVSPERGAAITLLGQLKKGVLPEPFTTRDVYLKGWSGLNTPEEARKALAVLERHCWVMRVKHEPTLVGGRPSEVWNTTLGWYVMQSKWLTWQPGSVGFEGLLPGENSIIRSEKSRKDEDENKDVNQDDGRAPYTLLGNTAINRPTKPTDLDEPKIPTSPDFHTSSWAEKQFAPPHARLFPFLGRKVRTPQGSGVLLQVFAERVTVLLDSDLDRCSFFQPAEVEPVNWELP